MTIRKINGPRGVWLEINHSDAATPALVCCKIKGELHTSTYDCATGSGFIDDVLEVTPDLTAWLEKQIDIVEEAFEIARKDHPEYA